MLRWEQVEQVDQLLSRGTGFKGQFSLPGAGCLEGAGRAAGRTSVDTAFETKAYILVSL